MNGLAIGTFFNNIGFGIGFIYGNKSLVLMGIQRKLTPAKG